MKKLPFVRIQKYQKAPSVKLGIGQNIVLHGSPTVNFFFSFLLSPVLMKLKGTRDVTSRPEFLLMQDSMVCAWFKKRERDTHTHKKRQ